MSRAPDILIETRGAVRRPRPRLSRRARALLSSSRELLARMTPGNVAHHRGNLEMMLSAVQAEAEGKSLFSAK